MNLRAAALGLVLLLLASACGISETDLGTASIDGAWQLESGTVAGEAVPLVDGYRITFTGEGTSFGGTAACNQYGATVDIDGGAAAVTELFVTEIACDPEVMDSEATYLTGLQAIDRADRTGDRLVLAGPDVELEFVAVPPVAAADLIGTTWVLESLVDGETVSTSLGELVTAEFLDDGTFMALTGCRTLTGAYVAVGDEIATPSMSAEGECTAELQSQDSHIVTVFEGPFTIDIDGDLLTLTIAGDEGLMYRAG